MSHNYQDYTQQFFKHLAQKQLELAVNTLFQTNPWFARNLDQVNNINSQLKGLPNVAGDYLGFKILAHKTWQDLYAVQYCMAIYDRQPVTFEFQYYKPRDAWRIQNFNFSCNFSDLASDTIKASLPTIFE